MTIPQWQEYWRNSPYIIGRAALFACIGCVACGTGSPTSPSSNLLAPLVPCGVLPNYVGAGLWTGEPGKLYRWERFPLQLSIDSVSLGIAGEDMETYEDAIRDGAATWSLATGGIIGAVNVNVNAPSAHILVTLSHSDLPQELGVTHWEMAGRVLRTGTSVTLFPEEISAWVARIAPANSNQPLRTYIAKIMAHEMGHALGVNLHSPDARDIMFGGISDWSQDAPPYPWITENDRNTIGEAYCR